MEVDGQRSVVGHSTGELAGRDVVGTVKAVPRRHLDNHAACWFYYIRAGSTGELGQ